MGSSLFHSVHSSSLPVTKFSQLDACGGASHVQPVDLRLCTAAVQVLDQAVHLCLG